MNALDEACIEDGLLVVHRQPGVRDADRQYTIIIDDRISGLIRDGESKSIAVSAGPHTLQLHFLQWATSRQLNITAAASEPVKVYCRECQGIFSEVLKRHNYIDLQLGMPLAPVIPRVSTLRLMLYASLGAIALIFLLTTILGSAGASSTAIGISVGVVATLWISTCTVMASRRS